MPVSDELDLHKTGFQTFLYLIACAESYPQLFDESTAQEYKQDLKEVLV